MPPTDPIREALLEARASCVDAITKVDAALKKIEFVEDLRIVPRHGRIKDAILKYMRLLLNESSSTTHVTTSPKEVHEALLAAGLDVSANAVHQTMYRMGKSGLLHAMGGGVYVLVKEEGGKENGDGSQDLG